MALGDGRALPASVLAGEAGVAASTASAHLSKLARGGLLAVERHGRHRYFRLAGPAVSELIEALARLSPPVQVRSLKDGTKAAAVRFARTCYDHLAGRLAGEAPSDSGMARSQARWKMIVTPVARARSATSAQSRSAARATAFTDGAAISAATPPCTTNTSPLIPAAEPGELALVNPDSEETLEMWVTASEIRDRWGVVTAVEAVLQNLAPLRELERRRVEQALFQSEKLAATGRLRAFSPYGPDTGAMWHAFRRFTRDRAEDPQRVVAAAGATFRSLAEWCAPVAA